jgi:cytochrome c oxidase subunit 2
MNWILPLVPVMASTLAERFEYLFWYIVIVTGASAVLVYGAMLYFCVAFRRTKTNTETPRILGSARLEIAWTIIPTIIFFTFFAWGAVVYRYYAQPPRDAEEIFIIGKQWMWKAQYSPRFEGDKPPRVVIGGNPANMEEVDRARMRSLMIPINRPVRFTMISEDVIHSFGIPAFRTKTDVLPGRYTTQWHHPTRLGEYHIYCNQYCGTWHSLMVGKVEVVTEEEYQFFRDGWRRRDNESRNPVDGTAAADGKQLFLKLQCIKCHSADSQARAPVLEELYNRPVPGYEGLVADADYIQRSILNPREHVVRGWKEIMPSYEGQLTAEEMNALVAYLKGLPKGGTPKATDRQQPPDGAPTVPPKGPGSGSEVKKP